MYAILDIETTGGKYNEEGITEIAIYRFDGIDITDQFICLINPERKIQPFVEKLTGITNKMVLTAPKFYEVAKRIIEITEDCTIVAHNSQFDYRILRTEFSRLGFDFIRNTLCTVSLSQKTIPGLPSYSLGKLCKSIGIPLTDRHRAMGDAMATLKLFKILLAKNETSFIKESILPFNAKNELSPKASQWIEKAPTDKGIFMVHNGDGNVIFIGKNNNLKKGLNKLFLAQTKGAQLISKTCADISFENTGNELFTKIRYQQEIAKHKPRFNRFYNKKVETTLFNHDNLILIDKGRNLDEKAVILIENNQLSGYGYIELAHQISNIEVLKNLIAPLDDKPQYRFFIKSYMLKNKFEKIIRC